MSVRRRDVTDSSHFFTEVLSRGLGGLFEGELSPTMRKVRALGLSALVASGIAFGAAIYRRGASVLLAAAIVAPFTLALACGFICSASPRHTRR
jgi:hypothetical protein